MEKTALQTMEREQMLNAGDRVVVGVSGGADSMALLYFLAHLPLGLRLFVVHVHHGIRGPEADADAGFVQAACKEMGIVCRVVRVDVPKEAARRGVGEEAAGRALRYEAFAAAARDFGAAKIALAHTQNDQAETVLLWLCRGAGLSGLTGIPYVRETIIRPLLDCSRTQVEAYCRANAIAYRTDGTNQTDQYTRNRVRRLLSLLEAQVNSRAAAHMAQTASLLREEDAYLEEQARAAFRAGGLETDALRALPLALRRRVVRLAYEELAGDGRDLTQRHTEAVLALLENEPGKQVSLPRNILAEKRYRELVLRRREEKTEFCYPLPPETPVWIAELQKWALMTGNRNKFQRNLCTMAFDYDTIIGNVVCRSRKAGDVIALPGGRKKLKDLFIDQKVPRTDRDKVPVFACEDGILWAAGHGVSQRHAAGEQTQNTVWIVIGEDLEA